MNSPTTPQSSSIANTTRPAVWIDTHASEFAPAYPALFSAFFANVADPVSLGVRARPSRPDVLRALANGDTTLAVLPASLALRCIARGLAAKIVCAAVSPVDLAHIDLEPTVPWDRVALAVRHLVPRAVLVAPQAVLDHHASAVGDAIAAYWRGASEAAAAPGLLGVVLSAEFGWSVREADRVARRAIASWRMDPAVRLVGLRRIRESMERRGEIAADFVHETALDQRFVAAEKYDALAFRSALAKTPIDPVQSNRR